jgi:hypothetical protein
MDSPPPRHDRYGRPVPHEEATARQEMAESPTNRAQRERILRRLQATLEEHYPSLLRPEVSAEVTLTFKVTRGTIQEDVYIGIVRQYRREE